MALQMDSGEVRPAAFRLEAFLEDWLIPIEARLGYDEASWRSSATGRFSAWLVAEAHEWIELGKTKDYFANLMVQTSRPGIADLIDGFESPGPSRIRDADAFGWLLAEAQEDLTPAREEFLVLMLFEDSSTFNARLAEAQRAANSLRARPEDGVTGETADRIAWLLEGGESELESSSLTPASWRGQGWPPPSLPRVLNHSVRWIEVEQVRNQIRETVEQAIIDLQPVVHIPALTEEAGALDWNLLGVARFNAGDLSGAMDAWHRAEELGSADAANNLGVGLELAGNRHDATTAWRRAEAMGSPNGTFNLGVALLRTGDREGGMVLIRRAAEMGNLTAQAALERIIERRVS